VEAVGLEHHPPEPRIDGQPGQTPSERRQAAGGVLRALRERAELLEQEDPVADLPPVGRVDEAEVLGLAQAERRHLQQHARQARAQDLGIGEVRALREVLLGPLRWSADALEIGSIGSRCTFSRPL